MSIIATYENVGTYRATAAICGTTPKTVKRVIERAATGDGPPPRKDRARNHQQVADLVAERVRRAGAHQREAAAASGAGGRVHRRGAELPSAGRDGEEGLAGGASSGPSPGGVVPG